MDSIFCNVWEHIIGRYFITDYCILLTEEMYSVGSGTSLIVVLVENSNLNGCPWRERNNFVERTIISFNGNYVTITRKSWELLKLLTNNNFTWDIHCNNTIIRLFACQVIRLETTSCLGSLPTHAISLSWIDTRFQEHGNLTITGTPEMDLIIIRCKLNFGKDYRVSHSI